MYFQVSFPCDCDLICFDEWQDFFLFLRACEFVSFTRMLVFLIGLASVCLWRCLSRCDQVKICTWCVLSSFISLFHVNNPFLHMYWSFLRMYTYVYVSFLDDLDLSRVRLIDFYIFFGDEYVYVCVHVYTSLLRICWSPWYPLSIRVSKKTLFGEIQTWCVSTSFTSFSFCVCVYVCLSLTCVCMYVSLSHVYRSLLRVHRSIFHMISASYVSTRFLFLECV